MTHYGTEDIMPQTVPSKEEILTALAASPKFPAGSVEYEATKDYAVLLPEVIGEERLGQTVNLRTLIDISEEYVTRLLVEGYGVGFPDPAHVRATYEEMLSIIRTASNNPQAFLEAFGTTEDEIFLSPEAELSEELAEQYKRGTLTFGDIVRHQPTFFIE